MTQYIAGMEVKFVMPLPIQSLDKFKAQLVGVRNYKEQPKSGGSYCSVCLDNKPFRYTWFCRCCDKGVCGGCMKGLIKAGGTKHYCRSMGMYGNKDMPPCPLCRAEGLFGRQGERMSKLTDNKMADFTYDYPLQKAVRNLNIEIDKIQKTYHKEVEALSGIKDHNAKVFERQEVRNLINDIESLEAVYKRKKQEVEIARKALTDAVERKGEYLTMYLKPYIEPQDKVVEWVKKSTYGGRVEDGVLIVDICGAGFIDLRPRQLWSEILNPLLQGATGNYQYFSPLQDYLSVVSNRIYKLCCGDAEPLYKEPKKMKNIEKEIDLLSSKEQDALLQKLLKMKGGATKDGL